MNIEVWICEQCGSYYGATSAHGRDLTDVLTYPADLQHGVGWDPAHPMPNGNRAQCRTCVGRPNRVRKTIRIPAVLASNDFVATPVTVVEAGTKRVKT